MVIIHELQPCETETPGMAGIVRQGTSGRVLKLICLTHLTRQAFNFPCFCGILYNRQQGSRGCYKAVITPKRCIGHAMPPAFVQVHIRNRKAAVRLRTPLTGSTCITMLIDRDFLVGFRIRVVVFALGVPHPASSSVTGTRDADLLHARAV